MSSHTLLLVLLIHAAALVSPGPDFAVVTRLSIVAGRRAGLWAAAGVAAAIGVYVLVCVLGLSLAIKAMPGLSRLLAIAGALYLAWIGVQCLRSRGTLPQAAAPGRQSQAFITGFLTNLLNPKAALLYLSLLPQFIDTEAGHVFEQSLLLCAIQICISMLVNGTVILIAGSIAGFLSTRPTWVTLQRWLMGSVLAGLAVHMAAQARTR